MNFLAHIYLSGENQRLLLGNFIADSVKGNKVEDYEGDVRRGIRLHRFIDDFTDNNAIVRRTTARLRPEFGKFSPVVSDVFYDHFLAANWNHFHETDLKRFCERIYSILLLLKEEMPRETQIMLPYMIQHNWLLNYSKAEGVNRALQGLSKRTVTGSRMEFGMNELLKNYEEYKKDFFEFFPVLIAASENFLRSHR